MATNVRTVHELYIYIYITRKTRKRKICWPGAYAIDFPIEVYSFLVSFCFQSSWSVAFDALETAVNIANNLGFCSIM
jgi:hypothetical protein